MTDSIDCKTHGKRGTAFVCRHLVDGSGLGFYWGEDPDDPFSTTPDAWCERCEAAWEAEGEWNERSMAFADIRAICDRCYLDVRERNWREDEVGFARVSREVEAALTRKQDALRERFDLDSYERWDWDMDAGELRFSHQGSDRVIANILFVGSYAAGDSSWRWAWANASFPDRQRAMLDPVRAWGAEAGFLELVAGFCSADETTGWLMSAFAAERLDALGAYRTPTDFGHLYMILMDARWA